VAQKGEEEETQASRRMAVCESAMRVAWRSIGREWKRHGRSNVAAEPVTLFLLQAQHKHS
jgi:hypothetical protein